MEVGGVVKKKQKRKGKKPRAPILTKIYLVTHLQNGNTKKYYNFKWASKMNMREILNVLLCYLALISRALYSISKNSFRRVTNIGYIYWLKVNDINTTTHFQF